MIAERNSAKLGKCQGVLFTLNSKVGRDFFSALSCSPFNSIVKETLITGRKKSRRENHVRLTYTNLCSRNQGALSIGSYLSDERGIKTGPLGTVCLMHCERLSPAWTLITGFTVLQNTALSAVFLVKRKINVMV